MTRSRLFVEQTGGIKPAKEVLPTMYDLPSEDPEEPGLPDEFHDLQPQLLSATLRLTDIARDKIFTGTDLNLYYDLNHPLWYKRPDWFAVLNVPRLYKGSELRMSYVIWQEDVSPSIIVELISPGTEKEDLGETDFSEGAVPTKWEVYEQILQVPYYIVYDRYKDILRAYEWVDGRYQALFIEASRVWLPKLRMGLGLWHGEYEGISRKWLRWLNAEGNWIQTPEEKVMRLAQRLRELGIDPDEV
jgi:Uma2 family endonuclease